MKHIAIVGSGPAGCYLADQLLRLVPDARVDIVERLPVPFGLVRYGVAPDHQGTKAVARLLDRVLARDQLRFFGNVEVGRDVRLDELKELYDAVVLATGAPRDRRLGIPGESLPGVVGSASFVGWYNGHPDCVAPPLLDVREAVVIGNGNVAIDVARVLAKNAAELAGSDLSPQVHERLLAQRIETIHIVGRRGPADAKFTRAELAELGKLANARPVIAEPQALTEPQALAQPQALATPQPPQHAQAPERSQASGESAAILELLRGFAQSQDARESAVRIVFHFGATPLAFEGRERLESVRFARAGGEPLVLPAQLAVSCIGYQAIDCCTAAPNAGVFVNEDARIDDGLFVTGWAGRGPSGTIPTNRTEAQRVAQRIAAELTEHGRGGGEALAARLAARGVRVIDHAAWRRIDAAELARAGADRCRHKFESIEAMLEAAGAR
ncbi:MAG: FAD-dependent oxidoreductase [Burkholderiaceae bacterium]|nr:FAD-dependent oxidoreductase [Burkholderiaceae bacterium]